MFNTIIAIISALIPVGLIVLYIITRSLNKPVNKDDKADNKENTDKKE